MGAFIIASAAAVGWPAGVVCVTCAMMWRRAQSHWRSPFDRHAMHDVTPALAARQIWISCCAPERHTAAALLSMAVPACSTDSVASGAQEMFAEAAAAVERRQQLQRHDSSSGGGSSSGSGISNSSSSSDGSSATLQQRDAMRDAALRLTRARHSSARQLTSSPSRAHEWCMACARWTARAARARAARGDRYTRDERHAAG